MNKKLHKALEDKKKLVGELEAMLDKLDVESRDFNEYEQELFESKKAKVVDLNKTISQEEANTTQLTTAPCGGFDMNRPIGTDSLSFTNERTGDPVRTLKHGEPMCQNSHFGGQPNPVGQVLHNWLTGGSSHPTLDASLQQGNLDTTGGFLFEPRLSSHITDLARAASVCQRAGCQTLPMEVNELHLARVSNDPVAHWRPEGVVVPASGVGFDRITMRSHTLACIIPLTLELIEDAANAPALIEQVVASAIASEMDRVCLAGTGSESEPLGVRNHTNVHTDTSVGTPTDYGDITTAVQNILGANFNDDVSGLAWIQNPRDAATYDGLLDTTNQPLRPTPWAEKLQKLYTTAVSTTEGVGSDESYSIVGDFNQMVIGIRNSGVRFRRLSAGTVTDSDGKTFNATSQLLEHLVAHVRVDVALMRPTWFSLMTGITTS